MCDGGGTIVSRQYVSLPNLYSTLFEMLRFRAGLSDKAGRGKVLCTVEGRKFILQRLQHELTVDNLSVIAGIYFFHSKSRILGLFLGWFYWLC